MQNFTAQILETERCEVTIMQGQVSVGLCVLVPMASSDVKVTDPLQRGLRGGK